MNGFKMEELIVLPFNKRNKACSICKSKKNVKYMAKNNHNFRVCEKCISK